MIPCGTRVPVAVRLGANCYAPFIFTLPYTSASLPVPEWRSEDACVEINTQDAEAARARETIWSGYAEIGGPNSSLAITALVPLARLSRL